MHSGVDILYFLILEMMFPNGLNQDIVISPGIGYQTIQHWPKVGISILKIETEDVLGQYVTVEVDCMQRNFLLMEKYRKCLDEYKIENRKTTYIQLPKTYKELYIISFYSITTNGNQKPQRVSYELITDDKIVEKIQNSIFDMAL